MIENKKEHPAEKQSLHPRNKHRARYNFKELVKSCPPLAQFVIINQYHDESIDFSDPKAVMMLNKALLTHFYGISHWNIPNGYLCPPIPGRSDYIHYIADVLKDLNNGVMPSEKNIKCLDIGVGANCIYPIVGVVEYGWSFVGTDIDPVALKSASEIVNFNEVLNGKVELRLQNNSKNIFNGIVDTDEAFDLTMCNPPFHASQKDAQSGTLRKLRNLNQKNNPKTILNFGGHSNELWTEGGELKFIRDMISQSKQFTSSCFWFSTLISKQSHLNDLYKALEFANALEIKTIQMNQGNKSSRILAWTFLNKDQQKEWIVKKWN